MYKKNKNNKLRSFLLILLLGIGIGIISKILDEIPRDSLPIILNYFDISRFLSRMPIWLFLALLISIHSKTALIASGKVFIFFTSMLFGYYLYSLVFLDIYQPHQITKWVTLAIISPVLAFICWHINTKKNSSIIIAIGIMIVMIYVTFFYHQATYNLSLLLDIVILLLSFRLIKTKMKLF